MQNLNIHNSWLITFHDNKLYCCELCCHEDVEKITPFTLVGMFRYPVLTRHMYMSKRSVSVPTMLFYF